MDWRDSEEPETDDLEDDDVDSYVNYEPSESSHGSQTTRPRRWFEPLRPLSKELDTFDTNPERDWRRISIVERPKRSHYFFVDNYREFRDLPNKNRSQRWAAALLYVPAMFYKYRGQHRAIEVETEYGLKYWDADKGADGYLIARSGFWQQEDIDHITKRGYLGKANYDDMENNDIWCDAIEELNQRGPYDPRKNSCRDAVKVVKKKYLEDLSRKAKAIQKYNRKR